MCTRLLSGRLFAPAHKMSTVSGRVCSLRRHGWAGVLILAQRALGLRWAGVAGSSPIFHLDLTSPLSAVRHPPNSPCPPPNPFPSPAAALPSTSVPSPTAGLPPPALPVCHTAFLAVTPRTPNFSTLPLFPWLCSRAQHQARCSRAFFDSSPSAPHSRLRRVAGPVALSGA